MKGNRKRLGTFHLKGGTTSAALPTETKDLCRRQITLSCPLKFRLSVFEVKKEIDNLKLEESLHLDRRRRRNRKDFFRRPRDVAPDLRYRRINRKEIKALGFLSRLKLEEFSFREYKLVRYIYLKILPRVDLVLYRYVHQLVTFGVLQLLETYLSNRELCSKLN
ncbi:ORF2 [Plasmodium vivax Narna-Like virus 1]|nr:ORF2 [Plasmodium vivax Narna-Like virus 1]